MRKKILSGIAMGLVSCVTLTGCGANGDVPPAGNPFDATKLPFYEANVEGITYSYTDEERVLPFWEGNVMRNEQLMVVEKDGVVQGKLLYPAEKVISVRDWSLTKEYVEGVDYVINGDTLTLPEGSSIPVFKDEWSRCENIPSQYPAGNAGSGYQDLGGICYTESSLIWSNYIHVSYVYDAALVDRTLMTEYNEEALYGLNELFETKEELQLVVFGDSISEGCSASELWGHEPKQPAYAELVRYGIEQFSGVKTNLKNLSVGGKDSNWAAEEEQLAALMSAAPDILVIGFGTNDAAHSISGNKYINNIRSIIEAARMANSACQIILLAPFPSNPDFKSVITQEENVAKLRSLVASQEYLDVTCVSLYEGCMKMLEKKQYYEIAGNNINHPNDFVHRYYAMNILSAMFDFNNLKK